MPRDLRELRGYGRDGIPIPWPDGVRMAVSVVLNLEEGSHRSPINGDASGEQSGEGFYAFDPTGDARIESWHEYGQRAAFPRLHHIFQAAGIPVTVYAAALALERSTQMAELIRTGDYEVCSHGHRWVPTNSLGVDELRAHVEAAVASLQRTTGRRPVGWFSRGPNAHLRDVLRHEGGFLYDSDAFSDDVPYFVQCQDEPWLVIPYSFTFNDMKYWRSPGVPQASRFLELLKDGFDRLYQESAHEPRLMSLGLHLRSTGLPSRAGALREFLEYASARSGVWFTTRDQIASWWWQHVDDAPVFRG